MCGLLRYRDSSRDSCVVWDYCGLGSERGDGCAGLGFGGDAFGGWCAATCVVRERERERATFETNPLLQRAR